MTQSARRSVSRADAVCAALLLVVTLAVYSPALFFGKVLLPADIVPLMPPWSATALQRFPESRWAQNQMLGPIFEYYSWRHYARERLRAGEVPLWNPYELGGNVLLANSQSAVLYPPNLLLEVLPLATGINWVTALHTFLTGLFLFGFLRCVGLDQPGALTGALAWMFCALLVVWTEFQTPTAALCWLPAALWCWELFARGRGWRWAVLGAGCALALSLLAGHLQFAFYVLLAFALYAVWRPCRGAPHSRLCSLGALAAAIAFGVSLSLATMLPVMEMGRYNFRAGKTEYAQSIGLRLPPKNLLTILLPNLYGNPRDYVAFDTQGQPAGHDYFGAFNFIEYAAYPGVPALALAAIAIGACLPWRKRATTGSTVPSEPVNQDLDPSAPLRAGSSSVILQPSSFSLIPRPSAVGFFCLLAAVGLLLALGTPLCAILFFGVPGYSQFNATGRALCLFSFGVAALAGFGVEALTRGPRRADGTPSQSLGTIAGWCIAGVAACGVAAYMGASITEMESFPNGKVAPRLLTDQWIGYERTGATWFALFLAVTAGGIWLLLRQSRRDSLSAGGRSRFVWLLPAAAAADLLVWGAGFNPMTDPAMLGYATQTTGYLREKSPDRTVSLETPGRGIKSFIVPNFNVHDHLREVQGADSLHTKRYHELLGRVVLAMEHRAGAPFGDPNTLHVPGVDHPFFDLMNVRYITTDGGRSLDPPYTRALDAELTVWENPRALGRAWIAGRSEPIHGVDEAFQRISDPQFDARTTALVERDVGPLGGQPGTAEVTAFEPHGIAARTDCAGAGILVLSETYFPGWHATVDGSPAPAIPVDYVLRGVPVPAGRHSVVLWYEPGSYRVGLYMSALAVAMLCGSLVFRANRRNATLLS